MVLEIKVEDVEEFEYEIWMDPVLTFWKYELV